MQTISTRLDEPEARPERTTANAVDASVDKHLGAIDALVLTLQTATATYWTRPLDWGDVAALGKVHDLLSQAVSGLSSDEAAAELSKAAREVATEVRQFRGTESRSPEVPGSTPAAR